MSDIIFDLPQPYSLLPIGAKIAVRHQYMRLQQGLCYYCRNRLSLPPPKEVTNKPIDWGLFPPNFLKLPIHLQHNHDTDMTEGAVHAYCNAVMWQYEGR